VFGRLSTIGSLETGGSNEFTIANHAAWALLFTLGWMRKSVAMNA
jgi:hypothetical protein